MKPVKQNLVFSRVIDVPVARVWSAWVTSEMVMRWWGPDRFTCPVAKMDVRVGHSSLVCMRFPKEMGGHDAYNLWEYEVVEPMKRLVYVLRFADKDGNIVDAAVQGLPPDMPKEVRNEVVFEDLGKGKTRVVVTEYDWPVGRMMELSRMGMEQCLNKMAKALEKS